MAARMCSRSQMIYLVKWSRADMELFGQARDWASDWLYAWQNEWVTYRQTDRQTDR